MTARHIGIVACSAEGAALCYRYICGEAASRMGPDNHPEISMHTYPLARYMEHVDNDDWARVSDLMLESARKLKDAGAHFAICPDNTIHQAFSMVAARSPIPWLHIAREVGQEARRNGFKRLGLLGTRYLMEGPVYREALDEVQISVRIPERGDREQVNRIIFEELVQGVARESSRSYLTELIGTFQKQGCEAVILGCTELPLIVTATRSPLPALNSTLILAKAAIEEALR